MRKRFLIVAVFVLLGSCDSDPIDESRYVATRNMSIEAHVSEVNNKIVNIEVMLRNGSRASGTDIYLNDEDSLFASSIGDFSGILSSSKHYEVIDTINENVSILDSADGHNSMFFDDSHIWYETTLSAKHVNSRISILLIRDNRLDAKNTSVQFPASFEVTSPVAYAAVDTSADIPVTWSATAESDRMYVDATLDCIDGRHTHWQGSTNSDIGQVLIPANTFQTAGQSCNISIRAERSAIGEVDSLFGNGGVIVAHRVRLISVRTQ